MKGNTARSYDLEERTMQFSKDIITFCKKCPKTIITIPLLKQFIRSATSIGANYREANGASSKKDFIHKVFICKKESKETLYWLSLTKHIMDEPVYSNDIELLCQECHQLMLIFSKIAATSSNKN